MERCTKEIVSSVARALAAKKNIELVFSGIGRLTIRESRVKMKFYKEFINEMDSSGKLVDSMMNVSTCINIFSQSDQSCLLNHHLWHFYQAVNRYYSSMNFGITAMVMITINDIKMLKRPNCD